MEMSLLNEDNNRSRCLWSTIMKNYFHTNKTRRKNKREKNVLAFLITARTYLSRKHTTMTTTRTTTMMANNNTQKIRRKKKQIFNVAHNDMVHAAHFFSFQRFALLLAPYSPSSYSSAARERERFETNCFA